MIVKMKFLNISGPRADIDRVCDVYLSRHEIQLENAMAELKTTDNLLPFVEMNPYKEPLEKAEKFSDMITVECDPVKEQMPVEEMIRFIQEMNGEYLKLQSEKEALAAEIENLRTKKGVLEPFSSLELDIGKVMQYQFMKVRFGRISIDYYQRLEKYLYDNLQAIFIEGSRTEHYVYGCYFVANADAGKVDSVFNSLHFEKIALLNEYEGMPAEALMAIEKKLKKKKAKLRKVKKSMLDLVNDHAAKIRGIMLRLTELSNNFDVRKMAARMQNENKEEYYILCGWMGEEDAKAFLKETENDDKVMVIVEEDNEKFFGEPPTKLKNPKFFKPFEMFIRMYGLPAENEMDPTIFVALAYTFIFGAMFGDVGQGLCLFIGGGLLYKFKKINLAGIISVAGLFSTFFGFMFGSVFGFEGVIDAVWLHPAKAMMNLPFIGQLNTVFIVAVAFGMALNMLVMMFQIINAAKAKDKGNLWFSHNGVAGLVFYGFLVLTIVLYMTGHKIPGNILLAIFLGGPVLVFVFKEPLTNIVEKNHKKIEEGKVMFFVQGFFELFETMLSYFSNTLSYVRVGAVAVSHAAMMEVVLMLSGALDGNPNWAGVVLGNLVVCGMEGLIVGIQVLRLTYYEMFSRFYKGTGREFKPFNNHGHV